MKIPKPKVTPDHLEVAGFLCLVGGAVCAGLLFSGPLAAWTLGLIVSGLLLVMAGNAGGEA